MTSDRWGVRLRAPRALFDLVREHGGIVDPGLENRVVLRLISPEHCTREDDLAVVTSARFTKVASLSPGVLLCQSAVAPRCPAGKRWIHEHAMYVVAKLLEDVHVVVEGSARIDPRAYVDPRAVLDPSVIVAGGAAVLAGARIGEGSIIGEGALIHGNVTIGARVVVGPLAVVGRSGFGWAEGPAGQRLRIPQRGGVLVEDDAEIGALCTVDAGTLGPTIIGSGVKLDAHVHVGHNVTIGEDTLVAAQSGFAGSARIAARVLVGGQVGVTDHASVGEGARIAAKSGVIGDVAPGQVVAGFPAVPRVRWFRAWAKLLGGTRRRYP